MGMPPNPGLGGGGAGSPLSTVMGALQNRTATAGQGLSQQASDLQGADPSMVLRQLEAINQVLGVLFVRTFQSLPNIANQISSTMKQLSRAIKEAQSGSSVSEVVGKAEQTTENPPPIQFGPAQPGSQTPASGIPAM
jgi:hypothetical protein